MRPQTNGMSATNFDRPLVRKSNGHGATDNGVNNHNGVNIDLGSTDFSDNDFQQY